MRLIGLQLPGLSTERIDTFYLKFNCLHFYTNFISSLMLSIYKAFVLYLLRH